MAMMEVAAIVHQKMTGMDFPEGLSFVFLGMLGLLASIKLRRSYL